MEEKVREAIEAGVAAAAEKIREISLKIHAEPELGYEEVKACAWQVEFLRELGFRVETPYNGLETAYLASIGEGHPTVAVLSEYDALPEIGHACGHNLITAVALAAGAGLKAAVGTGLTGTVRVMGTPAEEGGGGKVKLIDAGSFEDVDFSVMAHPSDSTADDVESSAIHDVEVRFRGKSAHAASSPHLGRNALDAVMLLFAGVNAMRQHVREETRMHGIVISGGAKPNIVPEHAACEFYLRHPETDYLENVYARFCKIAEGAALMTGCEVEIVSEGISYLGRKPNKVLSRLFHEEYESFGAEFVRNPKPERASSDAGNVSQVVPAIHPYFGIAPKGTAAHTPAFADFSKKDESIRAAINTGKALALAAARVMADSKLLKAVKKEFENTMSKKA